MCIIGCFGEIGQCLQCVVYVLGVVGYVMQYYGGYYVLCVGCWKCLCKCFVYLLNEMCMCSSIWYIGWYMGDDQIWYYLFCYVCFVVLLGGGWYFFYYYLGGGVFVWIIGNLFGLCSCFGDVVGKCCVCVVVKGVCRNFDEDVWYVGICECC